MGKDASGPLAIGKHTHYGLTAKANDLLLSHPIHFELEAPETVVPSTAPPPSTTVVVPTSRARASSTTAPPNPAPSSPPSSVPITTEKSFRRSTGGIGVLNLNGKESSEPSPVAVMHVPEPSLPPSQREGEESLVDHVQTTASNYLKTFIGYPCTLRAHMFDACLPLMILNLNNVGDPYSTSLYKANSHEAELWVIKYFADLFGVQFENCFGYVTSSGTEGNMQGLFIGREVFPDGVLFCSRESHYSIFKIARILRLPCVVVPTQDNGQMDIKELDRLIAEHCPGDKPVIISANCGTTMKGAVDDLREIYRVVAKHDKLRHYYLHCDGALMGFVLPWIEKDLKFLKHVHSIAISGHKYLGVPFPSGVFLMEKRFLEKFSSDVEYIGSKDCTISGSRNGHAPIFLRHILSSISPAGFQAEIDGCLSRSEYLLDQLESRVPSSKAWRNASSITVVLRKPPMRLISKWQLATDRDISHVVVLPHVDREKLDAFVQDLVDAAENGEY